MQFIKKINPIIAIVVSVSVFIIAIIIVFIFNLSNNSSIEILVAPESAVVKINNKTYKNGTHKLPSGTYTVNISKDGFTSKEVEVQLVQGETTILSVCLTESDNSNNWYNSHSDDRQLCTKIGDEEAARIEANIIEQYPISTIIPIRVIEYDGTNYTNFRIDINQSENCPTDFCLQITDFTGGNEERAYNTIRERGYNPNDYHILYIYNPIPMPEN